MKRMIGFGAAFFAGALAATAAETPAVFWASSPTRPGEHVLLGGGGWDEGEDLAVEIGGRRVKPDMVSRTGLVFGWPADLAQSVAEARVVGASGTSKPVVLNAPEVWWMQGDDHDASTPGGWLRVFGRARLRGPRQGAACGRERDARAPAHAPRHVGPRGRGAGRPRLRRVRGDG